MEVETQKAKVVLPRVPGRLRRERPFVHRGDTHLCAEDVPGTVGTAAHEGEGPDLGKQDQQQDPARGTGVRAS